MFMRVLFLAILLNTALARLLGPSMSVMAIWLFIAAVLQTRKSERPAVNFLKLRNPGRAQTSFAVRFAARPYHSG